MKPAAQKAMFWHTVCHYILSRSVVLLVVSWLFSWSEIKWYYVSSSSSEIIMMRYNSSNFAWIGGYMVKLWSPYCLHLYVLWVQLDGAFKYSQSSKSSTLEVYILISKKSKFFHKFQMYFLLWNIYSVLFFLFMFG